MIQIGNKEVNSIFIGGKEVQTILIGGKTAYEKSVDETDYFYIQNTYNGTNTVSLTTTQSGSPTAGTYATSVQYSKDKNSWTTLTLTAGSTNTITLESGEKVYFRNDSGKWNFFYSSSNYFRTVFTANQNHTVGGNINTLLDYSDLNNVSFSVGCFYNLFRNDSGLTSVPSDFLPTTTLEERCYYNMFEGCTSLTTAPALPATTLASNCYNSMFYGCSSLTTPPTLPATTLTQGCYAIMFMNCTALTTAPALPATTLVKGCYQDMFSHAGLTTPPTLPATTLAQDCYRGMLRNTPLTTSPALPATTLIQDCYRNMFYECTSLISAPTLPATTLTAGCYQNMFSGCSSLNSVTTYADDISANNCITNWLHSVANSGSFYNMGSATYTTGSVSGIPTGWTEYHEKVTNMLFTKASSDNFYVDCDVFTSDTDWDTCEINLYTERGDYTYTFTYSDVNNGHFHSSDTFNFREMYFPYEAEVVMYYNGNVVHSQTIPADIAE